MSDSERDFKPEPLQECRICGLEVPITKILEGVCEDCYRELADEFPEEETENFDEDEDEEED